MSTFLYILAVQLTCVTCEVHYPLWTGGTMFLFSPSQVQIAIVYVRSPSRFRLLFLQNQNGRQLLHAFPPYSPWL